MLNLTDLIKAIFLGIVEGLTEFIPVSSTAHLLISSYLIDFQSIKNNLFETFIQSGAILAICIVYRKKILDVAINFKQQNQKKFLLNIIAAFLPAAIIGVMLHSVIKRFFFSNFVIAIALIVGGLLMIIIDRKPRESTVDELEDITPDKAFKIGLMQCLAMIPGVSRSGATIIGGLLLGLNRKVATEFSFFLAIPTIASASLYDLLKNLPDITWSNIEIMFFGFISAFLSAVLVLKWFINFVSKNNFVSFGIYRILVGMIILFFVV